LRNDTWQLAIEHKHWNANRFLLFPQFDLDYFDALGIKLKPKVTQIVNNYSWHGQIIIQED